MRKTISFELSTKSINSAIKELKKFEDDFMKKVDVLRERIAEEIASNAQELFTGSDVERSFVSGKAASNISRRANVTVTVEPSKDGITVVVANGEDAVWAEFGTGVHYNGSEGTSPNPLGGSLGMTIGNYGQKNGRYDVWRYYKDGETYSTHGVPATMPMYNSAMNVIYIIQGLVREVFG